MKGVVLILVLGLTSGATAASRFAEKVSINLKNVTVYEAAAALTRESGIRVEVFPEAGIELRESFAWDNVLVGQALRQLSNRYQLTLEAQVGGAYRLNGGVIHAMGRPPRDVGVFERSGIRLSVAGVRVSNSRSARFSLVPQSSGDAAVSVDVAVRGTEMDPQRLAGLSNLVAKDDQGALLTPRDFTAEAYRFGSRAPEVWEQSIEFTPGHPHARKLTWIEGDVLIYDRYERLQLDLPLPRDGEQPQKQVGDVSIQLTRLVPGLPSSPDDGPGQLLNGGPRLTGVIRAPSGVRFTAPNGYWASPLLVGASGRVYAPTRSSGGTEIGGEGVIQSVDVGFAVIEEPIARVRLDLFIKAEPRRLFSFRLQDIPLPEESPFAPQANRPGLPQRPDRPAVPEHAPGETDQSRIPSGELISPVRIAGNAAPDGTLSLGLSRRVGAEWGATRWVEVRVTGGVARIPNVVPGTYRVFRAYRPAGELAVPTDGRWLNDELVVTLDAAKPFSLKPLEWQVRLNPVGGGTPRSRQLEKPMAKPASR